MQTAVQLIAYEITKIKFPRITFGWSWENRAFGFATAFAELGFTALVIGPLFVEFDTGI